MSIAESSLERSLSLLREQGLHAVDLHSSDTYRKVLFSHVDFLELYLKARLKFKHGMQSYRVTNAAFLGYESNVLYKISASMEELLRKALQSSDLRITGVAAYGLTQALAKALDSDALPVFIKLLDLIKISLALAMNIEDTSQRTKVFERLISAIENFGSYNLVSTHLDEALERLESLPRYGQALIASLNGILKEAVDRGDIAIFSMAFNCLAAMLPEGHRDRANDLYSLELQLKRSGLAQPALSEIEARTRLLREEVEFFRAISATRNELIFNLGGWTVKRYDEKQLEPTQIQAFMARIFPFVDDFVELTLLHLKSLTQAEDSYGWALSEMQPGAFQASRGWQAKFYIIAAVRTLRHAPTAREQEQVFRKIEEWIIPSSSLGAALGELRETSVALLSEFPKWTVLAPEIGERTILSEEKNATSPDRFLLLTSFWEQLLSHRRHDEEQALLDAEIPEGTKTDFAIQFKKNWLEYSTFRKLARAYDFFEDHTREGEIPADVNPWGILPQLRDKMWFVSQHQFASRSIAEDLGRALGELETKFAFDAIASVLEPVPAKDPQQANSILDAFIDSIPEDKISSYVLLSLRGFDFAAKLYDSDQFDAFSRAPSERFSGLPIRATYRKVPIIEVWGVGPAIGPCGVCIPVREMGVWHQYWARTQGEEIAIELEPIDEAKGEILLHEWASRGQENIGQPRNHAEAIINLRKKVIVRIWERFSYVPREGKVAIRIALPIIK